MGMFSALEIYFMQRILRMTPTKRLERFKVAAANLGRQDARDAMRWRAPAQGVLLKEYDKAFQAELAKMKRGSLEKTA